jgi:hypothetical protein
MSIPFRLAHSVRVEALSTNCIARIDKGAVTLAAEGCDIPGKKIFEPGKAIQRAGNFDFMPRQALANVLDQPR